MRNKNSVFLFSTEHRKGIMALIVLIVLLQIAILSFERWNVLFFDENNVFSDESSHIVSEFKSEENKTRKDTLYPFNPNYINDYKGYLLGMTTAEIGRLHTFRSEGKFVNSANEFQQITKISNEWLKKYSPYFKFPDWVTKKQQQNPSFEQKKNDKKTIVKKNINSASQDDLMQIFGIGEKLSAIILREKEKFGAFVTIEQLRYVWGISPEVFDQLNLHFHTDYKEFTIKKININEASIKELSKFPYFNYQIAQDIVTQRSMSGKITSLEDFSKINNFPLDKIKIIAVYLDF